MQTISLLLFGITWLYFNVSASSVHSDCRDFSQNLLTEILGPAFNSRYMSIRKPLQRDDYLSEIAQQNGGNSDMKRRVTSSIPSFYVDEEYAQELSDEPAWIARHSNINDNDYSNNTRERTKRNDKHKMQWECESKIKWIDLGPDYFPRYLRTVECTSKYCWYGHYKCKPRSFTVKILKRRRDKCINVGSGSIINKENFDFNTNVNVKTNDYQNGIKFDRDRTNINAGILIKYYFFIIINAFLVYQTANNLLPRTNYINIYELFKFSARIECNLITQFSFKYYINKTKIAFNNQINLS